MEIALLVSTVLQERTPAVAAINIPYRVVATHSGRKADSSKLT